MHLMRKMKENDNERSMNPQIYGCIFTQTHVGFSPDEVIGILQM